MAIAADAWQFRDMAWTTIVAGRSPPTLPTWTLNGRGALQCVSGEMLRIYQKGRSGSEGILSCNECQASRYKGGSCG
jgi:hypothetical protein